MKSEMALLLNALYLPNIGGVENSLRSIAQELIKRGFKVVLVCSDRNYTTSDELARLEYDGLIEIRRYEYPRSISGFFSQFWNCWQVIRDVVKIHGTPGITISRNPITSLSAFFAGVKGIKFLMPEVALFRGLSPTTFGSLRSIARLSFDIFLQFGSLLVSRKIYVFSPSMEYQVRCASIGLRQARLVAPGVDLTRFRPVSLTEKMIERTKFGLPTEGVISLVAGRFSEVKRFDLVIQALSILDEQHFLLMVGDGPELQKYRQLIDRLGLSRRVRLIPASTTPEVFYRVADQFLMTSRYESFGQVLLEATASGLPVVSLPSEVGYQTATKFIYRNYPALVRFSMAESPVALANAMANVVSNDSAEFFNQQEAFVKQYSWKKLVDDLSD